MQSFFTHDGHGTSFVFVAFDFAAIALEQPKIRIYLCTCMKNNLSFQSFWTIFSKERS
jgi:hypothetical protein